jgi:DNA-directed RNA polymerase I subunit RPA1
LEEWKGIKSGVAGGKRNKLFAQLLENKTNSCTHCSFHSAKLRKQRNSKVILEKFSEKMAKKNIEVMNSKRVNQLESDGDDEIVDDEAEDQGGEEDEERLDEMITSSIENKINSVGSRILFPTEMLSRLADLWKSLDGKLMKLIFADFYSGNEDESYKAFFMHNMMVPASKYRPCAKSGATGQKLEHAMNTVLNKIIETSNDMIQLQNEPAAADSESSNHEELTNLWISLQDSVNMLHDFQPSASDKMAVFKGMKQKFDKKHGLFRSNMMGKRVNFAARSVISPDVNLRTDEIGIPEIFAKKLTYPTPVTAYNVEKLRQAVINGPDVHPGANFIEDDQGRQISLAKKSKRERIALSNSLLAGEKTQKVLRHLESGDVLLVNRQPTLHKPGIMAHKARVLKGEQTIRMHYANV